MTRAQGEPDDERVLLLAPTSKDAAMTRQMFAGIGVACTACYGVDELCKQVAIGAGAVVLTEHACGLQEIGLFIELLRHQPPWSDLPVVVLAGGGANSVVGQTAMGLFGNVTVLERPVQMASLASVVRTLIRSRRRQYQIREHLREREALLAAERAARTEAERAGRVKDEFLATLSHELRTPLNAIFGWSQILRTTEASAEDLAEGLGTIERNARAQAQIIEDLLDMSRIINGNIRLDVQRVDLLPAIEAALETVRPAAEARDIRIHTVLDSSTAAMVSGDPGRLQQVFWNLLSNSVKFTPRGGRMQVLLERVASNLEISVIDSGEGISADFLPHVFDRFRQADASTTRRHGGLGLGLAIVKQLVELHGGTIRARSPGPGQGATFVVSLPMTILHHDPNLPPLPARRHPAASPAWLSTDREKVKLEGVNVLVVDDEPDARDLIRRLLEGSHATVVTASSAAEALEVFRRSPPSVLVSDIGMPHEDGYALIRAVRALDPAQGGQTPAVALTAYARSEDRVRALHHGFQMHVAKPVEPTELLTVIAALAGRTVSPEHSEHPAPA
ncbi:MAG TPA: ATP-binding protein [Tepidisphaeraceae bacterium]|nr:ATP-binding protein [Tepidisphaeraceae bacterium]